MTEEEIQTLKPDELMYQYQMGDEQTSDLAEAEIKRRLNLWEKQQAKLDVKLADL